MDRENQSGASQAVRLSEDPSTEGFDLSAGETWIYPTNYPTRDYQFNIIQKALLKNTLVSLPTGLGKTFIAAVVMYNFYRWYPEGKMIFMAPTKPLVKQQVDACYNIMAIPLEVTAELTGAKQSAARADIWTEKRVFYITPQVLQNDLNRIEQLGPKIKCLVFDEAHKARGNHAYCEVIQRLLAQGHKHFRVLALSATPGNTVNDVLDVVRNLLISHLEFRTEESADVRPYVFQRSLETLVVPLSEKLLEVREKYLNILEYYTKTLKNYKIIQGNCGSLTKGKIFMLMKDFQQKNRGTGSGHYAEVMRSLNICVTLYHAFELLIRHGLRSFLSFFEEHIEKPLLRGNHHLRTIVEDVRQFLGPIPNVDKLPDGTYPEVPSDIKFGHPKYYTLRDVLMEHFKRSDENTRVIVFFEYRESVMEANMLLLQSRPLIQPRIFLGQGSGITQKVQIGVVKAFREGKCNVLLSTCIGEEGLDVGEVDMIICFDISSKSPIRMVQRMGRTGRKRAGKVLVLVTEGKEQQTLKDCLIQKNNISTFVLGSNQLSSGMYPESPRLVPENIHPRCEKICITVKKKNLLLKKTGSIKDMLSSISSGGSSDLIFSQNLSISDKPELIQRGQMLFNKGIIFESLFNTTNIFSKNIEKQRKLQKTHKIKHSKQSHALVNLLQFSDSKRFNLPTQIQHTQANTKVLKQGDIRNMFLTSKNQDQFKIPMSTVNIDLSTQEIVKQNNKFKDSDVQSDGFVATKELFNQISNLVFLRTTNINNNCKHCPNSFNCANFQILLDERDILNNNCVPDDKTFEGITAEDIEAFSQTLDAKIDDSAIMDEDLVFQNINFTQIEEQDKQDEKSFRFQAPDTLYKILDKLGDSFLKKPELTQKSNEEFEINVENKNIYRVVSEDELLRFFKIDSFSDIFEFNSILCSSQETIVYTPGSAELKRMSQNLKSPEVLDGLSDPELSLIEDCESPVLSSEDRIKMLRKKVLQMSKRHEIKKDLFETNKDKNVKKVYSTPLSKNSSEDLPKIPQEKADILKEKKDIDKSIQDICDISSFLVTKHVKTDTTTDVCTKECSNTKVDIEDDKVADTKKKLSVSSTIIPLSELVDESLFDLLTPPINKNEEIGTRSKENINSCKEKNNSDDMFGDLVDDSFLNLLTQPNDLNKNTTTQEVSKDGCTILDKLENIVDDSFFELLTQCSTSKKCDDKDSLTQPEKISLERKTGGNKIVKKTVLDLRDKDLFFESTPIKNIKNVNQQFSNKSKNTTIDNKKHSTDEDFKNTLTDFSKNKNNKFNNDTQNKSTEKEDAKALFASSLPRERENVKENINEKLEDITFVDLTLDSPPKSTPIKSTSNSTQMSITQMVSFINKTGENCTNKKAAIRNPFGSQSQQTQSVIRCSLTSPKALLNTQVPKEQLMISTYKKSNNASSSSENRSASKSVLNENSDSKKKHNNSTLSLSSSLLNEKIYPNSSQKENEENKTNTSNSGANNSSSLSETSFLNAGWKGKARKNLLSTKRKFLNDIDDDFMAPRKPAPKELDPYQFITQRVKHSENVIKIQTRLGATNEDISSDDEFEVRPRKSPVLLKPRHTNMSKSTKSADLGKEETKRKKVKNRGNPFLDVEAELSEDDNVFVSSDEDENKSDYLEDSFVVPNATQDVDTQMHAHYLKSVRSPLISGGRFKIPQRPTHNISNIFSQPVNPSEENTYLEDSFCVEGGASQLQNDHDISELEILELKLKNRKKKRKKSEENVSAPKNKRRRIVTIESDSE